MSEGRSLWSRHPASQAQYRDADRPRETDCQTVSLSRDGGQSTIRPRKRSSSPSAGGSNDVDERAQCTWDKQRDRPYPYSSFRVSSKPQTFSRDTLHGSRFRFVQRGARRASGAVSPDSPFEDLGRPKLGVPGVEDRGYVLDFALRSRRDGRVFVADDEVRNHL